MKKLLFGLVISCLSIGTIAAQTGTASVSDNYINESIAIARFKVLVEKILKAKELDMRMDGEGNAIVKDSAKAHQLIQAVIAEMNKQRQVSGQQTNIPLPDGSTTITGGGAQQPPVDTKTEYKGGPSLQQLNGLVNSGAVEKEMNDLLAIIYADDASDLKDVENYTQQFSNLTQILTATNQYFTQRSSVNELQGGSLMSPAGLGSLESEIIYGITDFAISRAKEEILEAHLKYLYQEMNEDAILKQLIPHTLGKMEAFINDNSISMAKYGGLWKAAFQEDLRNMPVVMQKEWLVDTILTRLKIADDVKFQLAPVISGGDRIVYNLYLKKNLIQILSDMAGDYVDPKQDANLPVFKRVVLMSDIVTDALGYMSSDGYKMASLQSLEKMTPDAWDIFFKLVYLRNKEAIYNVMGEHALKLIDLKEESVRNQLILAVNKSLNLLSSYNTILPKDIKEVTPEDVARVYDLQLQVVDNGIDYLKIFGKEDSKLAAIIAQYEKNVQPILFNLAEIGEGLTTQQYGKVLDGSLNTINRAHQIYCASLDGATCDKTAYNNLIKYLTKYGSFMVNVIDAKDSDDVEEALDEIVPKGLYKLKFSKEFTITASLYPGAFYGAEGLKKYAVQNGALNKSSSTVNWASSLSFYLPIGVDFNWGFSVSKTKNMSLGLYLQAFDLGAVMNYRLNADSTESNNPEVSFQQLISPGASLIVHLPNSPIVVGGGVNYTPSLRSITDNNITYEANALRYGVFLAVDVTVIPLFISKADLKLSR
ncbi:MAG: hypothetical protein R2800_14980 [Flavipsychrobacter sp.]